MSCFEIEVNVINSIHDWSLGFGSTPSSSPDIFDVSQSHRRSAPIILLFCFQLTNIFFNRPIVSQQAFFANFTWYSLLYIFKSRIRKREENESVIFRFLIFSLFHSLNCVGCVRSGFHHESATQQRACAEFAMAFYVRFRVIISHYNTIELIYSLRTTFCLF